MVLKELFTIHLDTLPFFLGLQGYDKSPTEQLSMGQSSPLAHLREIQERGDALEEQEEKLYSETLEGI